MMIVSQDGTACGTADIIGKHQEETYEKTAQNSDGDIALYMRRNTRYTSES